MPTWVQFVYLLCAVCFILALKGLSGPKTARNGNLLGAGAAVVGCALPFFYLDNLHHVALIIPAIAVGTAIVLGFAIARLARSALPPQPDRSDAE